ncbi:DUF7010 family protein [Lactobacillus panisapium]
MPYDWLYKSQVYFVLSGIIPVLVLTIGINFEPYILLYV